MQERGLAELEGTRPGRDAKNPEMDQLLDMGDPRLCTPAGPHQALMSLQWLQLAQRFTKGPEPFPLFTAPQLLPKSRPQTWDRGTTQGCGAADGDWSGTHASPTPGQATRGIKA